MCRMMGVVSRGPVYYDLFEEFADLATKGMCPIGALGKRGAQGRLANPTGSTSSPSNLLGCLLSASYDLEDVRDLPEGGT